MKMLTAIIQGMLGADGKLAAKLRLIKAKIEKTYLAVKRAIEVFWAVGTDFIETHWIEYTSVPMNGDEIDRIAEDGKDVAGGEGLPRRIGICIGVLYVDKAAYGTTAYCAGADTDAETMFKVLSGYGFEAELLLNDNASWAKVKTAIENAAEILESGDLLVVTAAGHGGQLKDDDGDEADGLDETWCLYDREVRDDEILKLVTRFKPGVRLVLVNDQCHSEGNFREFVRTATEAVTRGAFGKRKAHSIIGECTADEYSGRGEVQVSLIQMSGCRESGVSYGSASGGAWTSALVSSLKPDLTWRQWFETARAKVGRQVPMWTEYGTGRKFGDEKVLR